MVDDIKSQYSELNDKYNFLTVETEIFPEKSGKLDGYTVSLKDAVWVKDVESCASSDILRGFKPVEHSTVALKILENGGTIIGKTVQDEFGFGGFSTNVGSTFTVPKNPYDVERSTGGSSGGAAVAASVIPKHIAISESTGGSIVTPAAFCGVVGMCPTYGRVSRYGLISYAASLDKIGVMGKTVYDAALGLEVISGIDSKDETSADVPVDWYTSFDSDFSGKKIAVLYYEGINPEIDSRTKEIIEKLNERNISYEIIKMPFMQKYALSTYYIIAMSEASTHLACLCGLRYGASSELTGNYDSYFSEVRTKNFGEEAKRRLMLGTFTRMSGHRGQYYVKALKVRTKIIQEYKKVFDEFEAIICPTTPFVAPKFDEIKKLTPVENYTADFLTVGPNLAGLPHLTVPIQKENELPMGIMIIGNHFEEKKILSLGKIVEELR
ncbi:Asp-tRNA(Asn)/Glu-tRNA(Gln) amidotransferase subunit GatA [Candidatus Woesearchaeota archaeon]|nr:Asp-tRNA(Asn)/Glu-tRNA(Gln) amidotransferase subunit GatA [Candidatus Woesearchaeota archaeon]